MTPTLIDSTNQGENAMKWPEVNTAETFEETERRLGITKETNDVRSHSLGAHPSASFYAKEEPQIGNLNRMRARFDLVADRYQ